MAQFEKCEVGQLSADAGALRGGTTSMSVKWIVSWDWVLRL